MVTWINCKPPPTWTWNILVNYFRTAAVYWILKSCLSIKDKERGAKFLANVHSNIFRIRWVTHQSSLVVESKRDSVRDCRLPLYRKGDCHGPALWTTNVAQMSWENAQEPSGLDHRRVSSRVLGFILDPNQLLVLIRFNQFAPSSSR